MPVPFMTIEGPIGAGKTSLSKIISETFDLHLLKEIVDENPFLDKFYEDIDEWSFQTEMFFLCNRYKQLNDIERNMLANDQPVVADYHIFKNLIFAKRTLQPSEFYKYVEIYQILTKDMISPNIVVYLYASVDTLMKRITMRGREFEKAISKSYIEQLVADYHEFIHVFEDKNPDIPVIHINGDELDFVHRATDLQKVLYAVEETLEKRGFKA
ncbi:deoxynucleoside kinase [Rummeliibacillus suwonensis]|uniref:deoxynucleoside kinase n=1 Tax=Rummeliibacillus suwonensis TaxID=1306154 RepID=UPI001AAE569F|nr:deoxynucleoside kinase [Rummeliibacillus suwonensis]MBO2537431.1 deoxynucleoside kinase [Rummeliibacillus suwonensis]